jgi:hypothetical protein
VVEVADRILEQGFEEDMHQIIKVLPRERQTILFSATQTRKVEDLARLSIQNTPIYVGVHDDATTSTVEGLQQGYVICAAEMRFLLLFTFLKKNKNKKIMVSTVWCGWWWLASEMEMEQGPMGEQWLASEMEMGEQRWTSPASSVDRRWLIILSRPFCLEIV